MDNDQSTEKMIQDAGATDEPRLTREKLEGMIGATYYLNAAKAIEQSGAPLVAGLEALTICIAVTNYGAVLVGKSIPISPANFREEIGQKVAFDSVIDQMWQLEGYRVKSNLAEKAATA